MTLTFDDVLILPGFSEILPGEVDLTTNLTRRIKIRIPIVSAAMDTISNSLMAIQIAKLGGVGVIHRNMNIKRQVEEVRKVKKFESWIIANPVTLEPDRTIQEAISVMNENNISGLPITKNGRLVGLITRRDLRFETNLSKKVSEVMVDIQRIVYVKEGISPDEAKMILHERKIEKLPILDDSFRLKGLITLKDIEKSESHPLASKDAFGRLMVAAAIGVGEAELVRAESLIGAGVDILVVDSAHGHSKYVLETICEIKRSYPEVQLVGGNVATAEGTEAIAKAGADAVKVGVGAGSICTTRVITGVGVPQISAILESRKVANKYDILVIADGGIRFSGDIVKALAFGADTVMLGNMLAGTEESPGETIIWKGRAYKVYRGMGSEEAIKEGLKEGVRSRYAQANIDDESVVAPEGVVGMVPFKGYVSKVIKNIIGGIKAGFGYVGAKNIEELRKKARFIRITEAGYKESHIHDVFVMKEPPNYRVE